MPAQFRRQLCVPPSNSLFLLLVSFAIPPKADTQSIHGHGALDLVGRGKYLLLRLAWTQRRLVVPFLIDDLEANHFVNVVEQLRFLVTVPYPDLIPVVELGSLGKILKGDEDVVKEVSADCFQC